MKPSRLARNDLILALHSLLISGCSVLILVGVVATPTNCACGAGTPHPHSLFLLAGHHHNTSGQHVRLRSMAHHANPATMHAVKQSGRPRLTALSGHASERIAMLIAVTAGAALTWRRPRRKHNAALLLRGLQPAPEPPPPRLLPARP